MQHAQHTTIELEYQIAKAKEHEYKKALKLSTGATPIEKEFNPDAWNQSLKPCEPIVFEDAYGRR